jgi:hypothetical protein
LHSILERELFVYVIKIGDRKNVYQKEAARARGEQWGLSKNFQDLTLDLLRPQLLGYEVRCNSHHLEVRYTAIGNTCQLRHIGFERGQVV